MGLLIKGGKLITADSSCFADIYCADQQISLIGRDLSVPPGTREIDATGKLRIKASAPTSDTDGTVVGAQS